MKHGFLLSLTLLLPALAAASVRESTDYTSVIESTGSGQRAASADYTSDISLDPIGGTVGTSPDAVAKNGFAGQLYEATGLQITGPATVNEGAAVQLTAQLTLDDATLLPQSAAQWTSTTPLLSVSAFGLATASHVYGNTPARADAAFAGFTAEHFLTILNTGTDDYGDYAGDGLPDDWQFQHFGDGNDAAKPDADPDGDGQDNLGEYFAGTLPTDTNSLLTLHATGITGGLLHLNLSRAQPGTLYLLETSTDLLNWQPGQTYTTPIPAEPFPFNVNAGVPRRFYRVRVQPGP